MVVEWFIAYILLFSCFLATVSVFKSFLDSSPHLNENHLFFSDTLLNVFLAIAVDNLANAQELTAAEEADERANEICDDSEDYDEQVITFGFNIRLSDSQMNLCHAYIFSSFVFFSYYFFIKKIIFAMD